MTPVSFHRRHKLLVGIGLGIATLVFTVWWRFEGDIDTPCTDHQPYW